GYCREMVRRRLPVLCDPPARDEMLAERPYMWSWQMDRTAMEELGAEYWCRKLTGKRAAFAGGDLQLSQRKLGVITEVTDETALTEKTFKAALKAECGEDIPVQIIFGSGTQCEQMAAV